MFHSTTDKPHPEVLSPEDQAHIAAVKEPLTPTARVEGNKLRIAYSGKPRAGATLKFTDLLAERLKSRNRPAGIVLHEVLTFSSADTAASTYLFTHQDDDHDALQRFADDLIAAFTRAAVDLPDPTTGPDFQLTVQAYPDRENQLNDVLAFFKKQALGNQTINLVALNGRRKYLGKDASGHRFSSDLRFVLTVPDEFQNLADPDPMKALDARLRLESELKSYGEGRGVKGEEWKVDLRPFDGHFMDTLAGAFGGPNDPEPFPVDQTTETR